MNYEQKYREALRLAKSKYEDKENPWCDKDLEEIFPELKESGDERIRNFLIDFIKVCSWTEKKDQGWPLREECIDWLEKQGEQKPFAKYKVGDTIYYNSFGRLVNFVIANIIEDGTDNPMYEDKDGNSVFQNDIVEQKSVDKVKQKFKVGDWIVDKSFSGVYQIKEFTEDEKVWFENGQGTFVEFLKGYRLWTIQDAKPGDILQLGAVIAIFKELIGDGNCRCYCSVCREFEIPSQDGDDNSYGCTNTKPATKEQRDTLMKAMADAGYEWNAEKKELKKIKQQ